MKINPCPILCQCVGWCRELQRVAGHVRPFGVCLLGGVDVDEAAVARDDGELAGRVDTTEIESPLCRLLVGQEVTRDRKTWPRISDKDERRV